MLFVFAVARENRHRVSNRAIPTGNGRSAVSLLFLIITGQPIYRGERFARDSRGEFPRRHIIRASWLVPASAGRSIYISIWIRANRSRRLDSDERNSFIKYVIRGINFNHGSVAWIYLLADWLQVIKGSKNVRVTVTCMQNMIDDDEENYIRQMSIFVIVKGLHIRTCFRS